MSDVVDGGNGGHPAGLAVDVRVRVSPATDHEAHGVVIDDFDRTAGSPVVIGDTRIVRPARRWAVMSDDGTLVFVDSDELRVE